MKKLNIWGIILIIVICVCILAISQDITCIDVIGDMILFLGKGIESIFFTPYTLFAILLILVFVKPDMIVKVGEQLSTIFEALPFIKLRNPREEQPISSENLASSTMVSNDNGINEKPIFYKKLLTCSGAMSIVRFMAYAIDRPGRPTNFTYEEVAKWTYGDNIFEIFARDDMRRSIELMSSVLIQTEILKGEVIIDNSNVEFKSTSINPSAHIALEQLAREGWQMTPQVIGRSE